jgi:hypothetical protein
MPTFRSYRGDIIPVSLHVAYSYDDYIELSKALVKKKILKRGCVLSKPGAGSSATCYFLDGDAAVVISLWEGSNTPLIAHEAVHAAMYFCDHLGISTTHENDETLSYLVQWVVAKVMGPS